ncbi:hypothetical protein HYPSUDRAFT_208985 [Hypholoma sublateritium FD-334 SS-4]|uniref:Uncharacterized protein n=1 Tax=Hypholoma sublateritium (strain FD-334 SS-4) TaxID=945553 RepID=A0A0D2NC18_HYPSF|nr:hypothetical protein HYPSUDRAFT_208985 [Hypholoma sublateritium FD-334 SS-4]
MDKDLRSLSKPCAISCYITCEGTRTSFNALMGIFSCSTNPRNDASAAAWASCSPGRIFSPIHPSPRPVEPSFTNASPPPSSVSTMPLRPLPTSIAASHARFNNTGMGRTCNVARPAASERPAWPVRPVSLGDISTTGLSRPARRTSSLTSVAAAVSTSRHQCSGAGKEAPCSISHVASTFNDSRTAPSRRRNIST